MCELRLEHCKRLRINSIEIQLSDVLEYSVRAGHPVLPPPLSPPRNPEIRVILECVHQPQQKTCWCWRPGGRPREGGQLNQHPPGVHPLQIRQGGEERTGSRCTSVATRWWIQIRQIWKPTTNGSIRASMRKSWVGVVINLISASFLFISARDKEHKESLNQSIQELGKPIAESLFLPPKDSKKGKTQVSFH